MDESLARKVNRQSIPLFLTLPPPQQPPLCDHQDAAVPVAGGAIATAGTVGVTSGATGAVAALGGTIGASVDEVAGALDA